MTISEVAKLAGVSSAAVSRYFNNGYISAEKKEAIRKVVEETGFRPSLQAQTLRTRKTKLIGVILPKINSESLTSVVSGILSVINESEYRMMLADTQNDPEKELEYLGVFNEKQVDGLILLGTVFTEKHKKILKNMSIPVVIVGQYLLGYPCIYHDEYHAAYDITKYVLNKGRKNLGFISAIHEDIAVGYNRYQGYCDAVRDAGMEELKDRYVIARFSRTSGYEKAKELLEKYKDIDAIIGATDSIAIGAMSYLKEQKIAIPEQIMVTGQGDSKISKLLTPTLTTIHYSYEESGVLAAQMVLELMQEKNAPVKSVMMGYSIIENESASI